MKINFEDNACLQEYDGREYRFDGAPLPSSVRIAGSEILAFPASVHARFGDSEGVWDKLSLFPAREGSDDGCFCFAAEAGNIVMNADLTPEDDGFVRINLRFMNFWSFSTGKKPELTGLYIELPLRPEWATLMHFWPNCDSGVRLSGRVLNSHAVPKDGMKLPFKPYVWLGREDGGIGICCESDRGFQVSDKSSVYEILPRGDATVLRINLIEGMPREWEGRCDEWGDNLMPLCFSFGIQATPVRAFPEDNLKSWRAFHLYDVSKHPIFEPVRGDGSTMLERIAASGANWLILHEDWTVIQNYGKPASERDFIRFSAECHALGLKLRVYFGYEISSLLPGFNELSGQMLNKNESGHFVGGWQREPAQRDFTVCYNGGYGDIQLDRVRYAMDVLGADGIYTDGTYVPWECANEAHGCGYRDSDGELHAVYPIFAVREYVKRLAHEVHSRGGIIDTHQSSCLLMPTLSFADSYFDGENIQGLVMEDPANLRPDVFRAEFMGRNLGIPCNFISYTTPDYTIDTLAGMTLIHGVYPRANNMEDLSFMSRLWRALDDYGIENAAWLPYYQDGAFRALEDGVCVSAFNRPGDNLLIIMNYSRDDSVVTLPIKALSASECLTGEAFELQDGVLRIPAPFASLRLVRVRSAV